MPLRTFELLIEQAQQQEHQASLALTQAQHEQQNYLQQLAQKIGRAHV